ncbi:MAG TPA: dihydrolipoyl dehydrogenase [Tepidisphaeraceae bacterium]|jgi:dihydrolipoamide dehydrogenase
MDEGFDLLVIGAGPGGYVAAIRAAQLGMKVACVEKEYLGGTCLNVGCIPSKALLDSTHKLLEAKQGLSKHGIKVTGVEVDLAAMMGRKDRVVKALTDGVGFLFKKNKIEHVRGSARIAAAGKVEVSGQTPRTLEAKHILIATGSAAAELPALKIDEKVILSSTGALALRQIPKRIVIVGAGAIGLELGSVWRRLGTEVLVLEFMDRILPGMDREMAGQLQKLLEKQGIRFKLKASAQSAKVENGRVQVTWGNGEDRGVEEADHVLVAVGRRPYTEGLGLKGVGVEIDRKGYVQVNDRFETKIPGIYAIGDVIGGLMLAHKAEEEGVAAVQIMAGQAGHVNYHACPNVVYTHPELAQVGFTEEDAREAKGEIKIGKFPLLANGRARCMDETEGLVKVIGDAKTDRLLGVHILAPHASDLIGEAAVAIEFAASVEDLARSFHAHPTLPEAIKEAALAADKRAIHIQGK